MLMNHEASTIIGITNVDLYQLCSNQTEYRSFKLSFEPEPEKSPLYRKVMFTVEISSDLPILTEPIENCLYVTFNAIFNLNVKEGAQVSVGFMAPIGVKVRLCQQTSTILLTILNLLVHETADILARFRPRHSKHEAHRSEEETLV